MQTDLFQCLLDVVPTPAMAIGPSDKIIALNKGVLSLFGVTSLNRNNVSMMLQPAVLYAIEGTIKDGENHEASYFGGIDGAKTTFQVICCHIRNGVQDTDNIVILWVQGVTPCRASGQMRRDFVSNVSNELRTPLTAMIGFIETLTGTVKDDVATRNNFLPIMLSKTNRMNRLVGDLLSLSRVEVDERVKPKTQVCLTDILHETIDAIKPFADMARVAFFYRSSRR